MSERPYESAFPLYDPDGVTWPIENGFAGMSLRDYTAIKAMQSLVAATGFEASDAATAARSYLIADALLDHRDEQLQTGADELARLRKAVRDSNSHYEELRSACETFWIALDNALGGMPRARTEMGELYRDTIGKVIDAPQGGTDAKVRTD